MTHNRAKTLEAFDYAIERITEASEGNGGLVNDAALNAYFMLKDHGKKIREALTEPKWKTMDSAPRDGTYILGYYKSEYEEYTDVVSYSLVNEEWYGNGYRHRPVTHWMPLPDAPTGAKS